MKQILIAEDDEISRKLLEIHLKNWNFEVVLAKDGVEAIEILKTDNSPQLAILDWMMPRKDGVEVCKEFRALKKTRYVYIILLTAKSMVEDFVYGLQSGADDYVAKPFDKAILQARINVGIRVVELENIRAEQLEIITTANQKMKNDLESAAKVQLSLLPHEIPSVNGLDFSWIYHPSDEVGGDMLNVFLISDHHVGFYILDVCGHGIQAALLSVAIRHRLSSNIRTKILNNPELSNNSYKAWSPLKVVKQLAAHYSSLLNDSGQYFTLFYAVINTETFEVCYVSAGHLPPIILNQNGYKEITSVTGLPVGMFDSQDYEEQSFIMEPEDSMFIYTDGIVEALKEDHQKSGEEIFKEILLNNQKEGKPLKEVVNTVEKLTENHKFEDDVTLLAITRKIE